MEQHVLERRSLEIAMEEIRGNKLLHNCRAMQMQKVYLYWMPAACVVVGQINLVCTFITCFSSISSCFTSNHTSKFYIIEAYLYNL